MGYCLLSVDAYALHVTTTVTDKVYPLLIIILTHRIVRKRAVATERTRLIFDEWGFDTSSMTKATIIEHLVSRNCTRISRGNPAGDFKTTWKRDDLAAKLHSILTVPEPYEDVDSFLTDVQVKAKLAGDRAVLALASCAPSEHGREEQSDSPSSVGE